MKTVEIVVLLIMSFCWTHCSSDPKPTLDYDRMVDLETDLYIAEEISRDYPVLLRDSMNLQLTKSILKIYNLTQEELDSNLYLYESDYELHQRILKDVKIRLDSLHASSTPTLKNSITGSDKK